MSAPPVANIPKLSEMALVLETARLRLRPFTVDDVDVLWPHVSDPRLPTQMSWNAHVSKAETRAFVESTQKSIADNTGITWAIEHAGEFVGAMGLHGLAYQRAAWRVDRAELAYWIGIPFHRNGYCMEAATEAVRFGFETLSLHKITVGCLDGNEGSRKVIERLGFRFIGRLADDVWRDNAWHTHLRYEMLASSYGDIAATMPINVR